VVAAADVAAANVMASGADLLHGLAVLDVVIVASSAALGARLLRLWPLSPEVPTFGGGPISQ
jgi:hypothetical protein